MEAFAQVVSCEEVSIGETLPILLKVLAVPLAQLVVEEGWGLLELRAIDASLEDVFMELTAEQSTSGPGHRSG